MRREISTSSRSRLANDINYHNQVKRSKRSKDHLSSHRIFTVIQAGVLQPFVMRIRHAHDCIRHKHDITYGDQDYGPFSCRITS
jgi:hypothetical protein